MVPALALVQASVYAIEVTSASPTGSLDVIAAGQVSQDGLQSPKVWASGHGFEAHLPKSLHRSCGPVVLPTLLSPPLLSGPLA